MILKNTLEIIPIIFIYFCLYIIANNVHMIEPALVGRTFIDDKIPFSASWIFIYYSSYLSIPLFYVFYFYKIKNFFIKSFLGITFSSFIIFMIYPTFVPRESLDLSQSSTTYQFLFNILHTADKPTNCLPSLHVSTATLISLLFLYCKNWIGCFSTFIYTILVALATMYIKQHYFYDVLAGFIISVTVFVICIIWENKYGKSNLE